MYNFSNCEQKNLYIKIMEIKKKFCNLPTSNP